MYLTCLWWWTNQLSIEGNCFFAAICQQLNYRPELHKQGIYTPSQLRQVCEYALATNHPLVEDLAAVHNTHAAILMQLPWHLFFTNMKQSGVFAGGPVLYCTALFLQLDIAVISFGCTRASPYMLVPGHYGDTLSTPPIYVGNIVDQHFQSFLPNGEMNMHIHTRYDTASEDSWRLSQEEIVDRWNSVKATGENSNCRHWSEPKEFLLQEFLLYIRICTFNCTSLFLIVLLDCDY